MEENINKEQEFHTKRTMFYFHENGDIRFPDFENENKSHKEWFDSIGVDIEKVIRGYRKGYNVYVYIGEDFRVPNLNVNQYYQLKSIFNDAWDIYLGVEKGEPGEEWKPLKEIKITNA